MVGRSWVGLASLRLSHITHTPAHSAQLSTLFATVALSLQDELLLDFSARGKFMSVFVSIIRGEYDAILPWPFHHKITLSLLDQCDNPDERKNVNFVIKPNTRLENKCFLARPDKDRNASFGAQNFLELDAINQFTYIKDDTIFIGVQVDTTDLNNFI